MRLLKIPLAIVGLCAACGGSVAGPSDQQVKFCVSVAGVQGWRLASIDGASLPARRSDNGTTVTVTRGTLTIQSSGAYSEVDSARTSSGAAMSITEAGTWTLGGSGIVFHAPSGATYDGSFGSDSAAACHELTRQSAAGTLVYTP